MTVDLAGFAPLQEFHRGRVHVLLRTRRLSDLAPMVVKTLREEFPSEQEVSALRHEFALLESLDVPGLPAEVGMRRLRGLPALIMRDAGPRNLKNLLSDGPLPLDTFFLLARAITLVVHELHSRDILHRDINPSNIVLRENLEPTLVDFEIASATRVLESDAVSILELEGTLSYLSPEQTGRTGRPIDARSDLYSLGATFYEMLVGSVPFDQTDSLELVHAHLTRMPVAPHLRRPEIPVVLSQLVLKLMEKEPEQRYQSSRALRLDLERMESHWQEQTLHYFHPEPDPPRGLHWSRLYGRKQELELLRGAVEKAARGELTVGFISGPPGIGKTALLRGIQAHVSARSGTLVTGRFEERARLSPYSGFVEAFSALAKVILAWPPGRLGAWQQRVRDGLGTSIRALFELIPELSAALPDTPPLAQVGLLEARFRLHTVLRFFLGSVAPEGSFLVLCLDDVHWMDPASIALLESLLLDSAVPCPVLFLLSSRTGDESREEIEALLKRVHEQGRPLISVVLKPFSALVVVELMSALLELPTSEVEPLAIRLYQWTSGSPLFLHQVLTRLEQEDILFQDEQSGRWRWNMSLLNALTPSEDLVTFLVTAVRQLPAHALSLLQLAAAQGERFELELVAKAAECSLVAAAEGLWISVQRGLILPLQASYRVLRHSDGLEDSPGAMHAVFRFMHARVQQAVSATLAPEALQQLHHRLAQVCLEQWRRRDETGRADYFLFSTLHHFRLGPALTGDVGRTLEVAQLCLEGARVARKSGGWRSGLEIAQQGLALLEALEEGDAALRYGLYREALQGAVLEGEHEQARAFAEAAMCPGTSIEMRLPIIGLLIQDYTLAGEYAQAIQWATVGLSALGIALPLDRLEDATQEELTQVERYLDQGALALLETQSEASPLLLWEQELLFRAMVAGFFYSPWLNAYCVVRLSRIALTGHRSGFSLFPLTFLGHLLGKLRGQYVRGYQVAQTVLRFSQSLGDATQRCRALHIFGTHVSHWCAPLQDATAMLREAQTLGQEVGELEFSAYSHTALSLHLLSQGEPLQEVLQEVVWGIEFSQRTGHRSMQQLLLLEQAFIRVLQGAPVRQTFAPEQREGTVGCIAALFRLRLACLQTPPAPDREALALVSSLSPYISGLWEESEQVFYSGLLSGLLALEKPDAGDKTTLLTTTEWLRARAVDAPSNFSHRVRLLEGLAAQLEGEPWKALVAFDEAAQLARSVGFKVDEALAHERGARLLVHQGRVLAAKGPLEAAARCYALWGANEKVQSMIREFPDLELVMQSGTTGLRSSSVERTSLGPSALDLLSLLKASTGMIGELKLERLMSRLLRVVLETAGAELVVLVLEEQGILLVRARLRAADERVHHERTPLDASDGVPPSMVSLTRRSGRPLLLADATKAVQFREDPYVLRVKPRAVLCLPIQHLGRSIGVLYLENNFIPGAFNSRRQELLTLLSAQIAIALENGRLYQGLEREIGERIRAEEELRSLNAELELRVKERTRTLEQLNQELEQFAYTASHDLQEPLRTITGFLAMLDEDYGSLLPEEGRGYIRTAIEGATRMRDLIRDLLAWSKAGASPHPAAAVELNLVVTRARQALGRALAESGAELQVDPLPRVLAHERELVQVFQNLISNAVKFRRDERPKIRISAVPLDGFWELRVQDNGIGISPAFHQKIFQVFQRLHSREQYSGTGIGLAIVRKIIERLGGSIQVESEESVGTTFRFTLPAVPGDLPNQG